jgi:hypothetical protein
MERIYKLGTVSKEKAAYLWNELVEYEKNTKMAQ